MKGLLTKDFLNLKGFGRTTVLIIALYAVISFVTGNAAFFSSLALVFCAMLPMSGVSIDEQAKWPAYAQCMPVSRKQVVLSKYIMVLVMTIAAIVMTILLNLLISLRAEVPWLEVAQTMFIMACFMLVMTAIVMPIILKSGVEKARLLMMVMMLIVILPTVLINMDNLPAFVLSLINIGQYVLPVLAIVLFIGSYFLSVRIYEKKEL